MVWTSKDGPKSQSSPAYERIVAPVPADVVAAHRELYFLVAKGIASVDEKYRPSLCRDFRINPKDVEAAAASFSRPERQSPASEMPSQERAPE
jgi:hypothetical protein